MEAKNLEETLVDEKTTALVDELDKALAVVEKKTLSDTMGDVKAKALKAKALVDLPRCTSTQLVTNLDADAQINLDLATHCVMTCARHKSKR